MEKVEGEQKSLGTEQRKTTVKESSINNKKINQCPPIRYHQQYTTKSEEKEHQFILFFIYGGDF